MQAATTAAKVKDPVTQSSLRTAVRAVISLSFVLLADQQDHDGQPQRL
jgi:hypothetical protein